MQEALRYRNVIFRLQLSESTERSSVWLRHHTEIWQQVRRSHHAPGSVLTATKTLKFQNYVSYWRLWLQVNQFFFRNKVRHQQHLTGSGDKTLCKGCYYMARYNLISFHCRTAGHVSSGIHWIEHLWRNGLMGLTAVFCVKNRGYLKVGGDGE